jgi:ubiquinone/menaquinone biosynthesis C-methylase UbiE
MLAQAMGRSPTVQVISGRAEKVPFADEFFDLTFSVDVVHHIVDRPQAFNEAWRALRPNGRICIVTDSGDILRTRQPQSIYFPESVDVELSRYPSIELLRKELAEAHFGEFSEVVVEFSSVLPDLEPYRAKVFSSLRLISDDAFALGMARLEKDFRKGLIPWVSRYLMLWGRKLPR